MYKHIIAAARELNAPSGARAIPLRNTLSASPLASKASDTGASPSCPLATIDRPRALMAGERRCSSGVPRREGRTPTQAPHIREREGEARLATEGSSLAGMKFRAQRERTSRVGQLRGRVRMFSGLEGAAAERRRAGDLDWAFLWPFAVFGWRVAADSGLMKIRSAG